MQSTVPMTVPNPPAQCSAFYPHGQFIITPPSTPCSPALKGSSNVTNELRTVPVPRPQSPTLLKPGRGSRGRASPSKPSQSKKDIVGNPVKAALSSPMKRNRRPKLTVNTSMTASSIVLYHVPTGAMVNAVLKTDDPKAKPVYYINNVPCYTCSGDALAELARRATIHVDFPFSIWNLIHCMRGMDYESTLDSVCYTLNAYPENLATIEVIHEHVAYRRPGLTMARLEAVLNASSVILKVERGEDGSKFRLDGLTPVDPGQVYYAYLEYEDGNRRRHKTCEYIRKEMRRLTACSPLQLE